MTAPRAARRAVPVDRAGRGATLKGTRKKKNKKKQKREAQSVKHRIAYVMPDEAAEANNVQLLWLERSRQNALKSNIKAGFLLSSGTQRAERAKQSMK